MTREDLYEKIDELIVKDRLFICISGRSCSGKSTLAKELKERYFYMQPLVLCQDMWYKNLKDIRRDGNGYPDMEAEDAFYTDEMYNDVDTLRKMGKTFIPYYSIERNERMAKGTSVDISALVILEGLHTVDIFKHFDSVCSTLYVYVGTPYDVCENRRIQRDVENWGLKPDFVWNHYRNVVEPHYKIWGRYQEKIIEDKGSRGIMLLD